MIDWQQFLDSWRWLYRDLVWGLYVRLKSCCQIKTNAIRLIFSDLRGCFLTCRHYLREKAPKYNAKSFVTASIVPSMGHIAPKGGGPNSHWNSKEIFSRRLSLWRFSGTSFLANYTKPLPPQLGLPYEASGLLPIAPRLASAELSCELRSCCWKT